MKKSNAPYSHGVVPYIGTWIETPEVLLEYQKHFVVPYIGTWIETKAGHKSVVFLCRTLYRYVD